METNNTNTSGQPIKPSEKWNAAESKGAHSGRIFGGLIIVTIGLLLLARQMDIGIPHWVVSWEMILIVVGLYIGIRHSFRGPAWIVLILIGSLFLLEDFNPEIDIKEYIWPIVIIAIGLVIIFRPKRSRTDNSWKQWDTPNAVNESQSQDDTIDSVVIFGGVKKNVISKNFRGGELTTIFGGTELNLTQADVNGKIVLDITQIFGGAKLIVPPHWKLQTDDLVSIFGGLDDKRPIMPDAHADPGKVLVIKGTCIFGGIDIKSY